MYWHIYPLESTEGPLACFFSWNWTSRASIRSVEGDGMARERSIYRFQVFPSFITMFALYQAIQLLNFKCVIICFCWIYRGGGFISLENLLYFSKNFPVSKNHLTQVLVYIHLNVSAMLAYASLVALNVIYWAWWARKDLKESHSLHVSWNFTETLLSPYCGNWTANDPLMISLNEEMVDNVSCNSCKDVRFVQLCCIM